MIKKDRDRIEEMPIPVPTLDPGASKESFSDRRARLKQEWIEAVKVWVAAADAVEVAGVAPDKSGDATANRAVALVEADIAKEAARAARSRYYSS